MLFQSPSKVNSMCHMNHYIESWIFSDNVLSDVACHRKEFWLKDSHFISWKYSLSNDICACSIVLCCSACWGEWLISQCDFSCIEYRCQNACWLWYVWLTYHICDFNHLMLSIKMQAIFQIYLMPFNMFLHLAFRLCLVLILFCVSLQIDMPKHNCT